MDRTCVDSAIEQLSKLLSLPCLASTGMDNQVKALLLDLRFLQIFFSCLATLRPADDQEIIKDGFIGLTSAQATLEIAGRGGLDVQELELLMSNLQENVKRLKPQVRDTICYGVLIHHHEWHSSCTNEEISVEFMGSILLNLERLLLIVRAKDDVMNNNNIVQPLVKKQMESLDERLRFTRNFIDFAAKRYCRSSSYDKLEDFLKLFQAWTRTAASLSLLYWVEMDCVDQNIGHRIYTMLSDTIKEIMPCTPRVTRMYIEILKDSKISRPDTLLLGDILARFVDFLILENLVDSMEGDGTEIVREGLIFLISFLMDPPMELAGRIASLKQIEAAISKVTSLISMGDYSFVPGFREKVHKIKTEVKKHHVQMPKSSESNCPKIPRMGFIHFLLINLEEMMKSNSTDFIRFTKHKVVAIHRELHSLSLSLKDIMDFQNQYKYDEVEDLWTQTINVAYLAQGVISSCSIVDRPIWYNLICLSDILEEIKIIKNVAGKIEREEQTSFNAETSLNRIKSSLRTSNTSGTDGVVVGFEDKADAIVNLLTRGSHQLSIVSIVGMSGVGKTTLAKIAYNYPSVKLHFHKIAWCFVSQVYRSRDLFIDILKCIKPVEDVHLSNMTNEDLAELVRKCLMRQSYLIVMDDIWEIGAWDAIKESLPKDRKGSRIVLTSQNHNLASQTDLIHNTYILSVLTHEKSWKLLKEMLFHNHACPRHLLDVGKEIARKCQGLPLAIVGIADLLQKEVRSLDSWGQIEESSNPVTAIKEYMDIIELSYKHLPDTLKPCFLYFGAFQAGKAISARKLTLLWIAEGFVQGTQVGSLEVLAKVYLMELVNRSLVDVTKRSSNGGIKACRVHDLLHKFCIEKAEEEKFLHVDWSDLSHGSSTQTKQYYPYRLCYHSKWETFLQPKPIGRHLYSLLVSSQIERSQSHISSVVSQYFQSFKLLHILNLEGICLEFSFLEEIMSIVHLRYLAIRGSFMRIPSSIANLRNLRTLVVKGLQSLIFLPESIWKMKSLKHVHASDMAVISLQQGDHDHQLEDASLLVNNMNTFSTLALHRIADTEKLLRRLSGLQKLKCVVSRSQLYNKNEIQFPALAYLKNLQSLTLCTTGNQGPASCSWMHIQFQAFGFPSTLRKLTLYKLGLPWSAISIIQQLPSLEVLKLREQSFGGKRWDMGREDEEMEDREMEDEEFCKLRFLELSNLNIEEWNVANDPFPCLEQLVVGDCYSLVEIPFYFGRITTLQMIELHRCSNKVKSSADKILEEQLDWGNDELRILILDS